MRTIIVSSLTGLLCIPAIAAAQPGASTTTTTTTAPDGTSTTTQQVQVDNAPTPVVAPVVPAPSAYQPSSQEYDEVSDTMNAPMFTSGALVFAASYGASVIVASNDDGRGNNRLYVPVVGPWLALNDRGSCDVTKSSCDHETTAKVLLVADGIFQAAGVIGMIDGLLQPSTHRVITRTAKREPKVHVTPTFANGSPGLAALGSF